MANGMVRLQEQVVRVQNSAVEGGSGIKQKESCLNLYLFYLLHDKNEFVHRLLMISDQYAAPFSNQQADIPPTHTHTYTNIFCHCSDHPSMYIVLSGKISSFIQQMWGRELLEVPRCCIHTWPIRPALKYCGCSNCLLLCCPVCRLSSIYTHSYGHKYSWNMLYREDDNKHRYRIILN